jgi:hypothetical protein
MVMQKTIVSGMMVVYGFVGLRSVATCPPTHTHSTTNTLVTARRAPAQRMRARLETTWNSNIRRCSSHPDDQWSQQSTAVLGARRHCSNLEDRDEEEVAIRNDAKELEEVLRDKAGASTHGAGVRNGYPRTGVRQHHYLSTLYLEVDTTLDANLNWALHANLTRSNVSIERPDRDPQRHTPGARRRTQKRTAYTWHQQAHLNAAFCAGSFSATDRCSGADMLYADAHSRRNPRHAGPQRAR